MQNLDAFWYDIVGTAGVALIVISYFLLQLGRLRSEELIYSVLNGAGAALILISLYYSFNLPSCIVEAFWLVISLFGIGKYLVRRR
jgi:hypothetical protein